jgi:hypothetical protein
MYIRRWASNREVNEMKKLTDKELLDLAVLYVSGDRGEDSAGLNADVIGAIQDAICRTLEVTAKEYEYIVDISVKY